jgi:hypothetical protein
MVLPFDAQQFFAVFAAYNAAIWPAQVVADAVGLVMGVGVVLRHPQRERGVLAGLAAMWAWDRLRIVSLVAAAVTTKANARPIHMANQS